MILVVRAFNTYISTTACTLVIFYIIGVRECTFLGMQKIFARIWSCFSHITRASIPSLFLRFVLILKVYILKKIIVLISKKCPYFWLTSLFCLIFNKAAILRKPFSSWPKFFSVKALWHRKSNTIFIGTQRSKAVDRHEALLALQAVLVRSEG